MFRRSKQMAKVSFVVRNQWVFLRLEWCSPLEFFHCLPIGVY